MLKYPCLILEHDDTVVQSEATVNYPCFCETLQNIRAGMTITMEEYAHGCNDLGFAEMCRQKYGFTEQELLDEFLFWKEYSKTRIPAPFPGIQEVIRRQKQEGGMLFVVSHSGEETITRDYKTHFHTLPDGIYGWELPQEKRKPSPFPVLDIMEKYGAHIKMSERVPDALSGAMGNQMYLATFPTEEELMHFYDDISKEV